MNNNTAIFDNWLQELEANASIPAMQIDQHWEMLRKELQVQTAPSSKPFFRNPLFIVPVILLTTLGSLYFFTTKKEKTNSFLPSTESIQEPAINSSTVADTSPVNKINKKSSPIAIKEPITIQLKSDSAVTAVQERATKALPVKKVFGVTTSGRQATTKDTLYFVTKSIAIPSKGDTIYIQSANLATKPDTFKVETIYLDSSTQLKKIELTSPRLKKDTTRLGNIKRAPRINLNTAKDSSFILIADTNRYQQLEAILQEPWFKGKLVYIDLWGTRCGPCLEEFKQLPELKERYKGKDLTFLYLKSPYSFDDSKEWKEMVDQYHLRGVNVAMSIQFYVEGFWKKYAAKYPEERWYTIPTYLIADRNGTILDFDAPRPSNKEKLYPLLDKLLLE